MHIEEIIFKPAEERIDRQVHRTPRTVQYCTKQVKTLNLDMAVYGLESAVIQLNNLKLKPIPKRANREDITFKQETQKPLLNVTLSKNNTTHKEIAESKYILERIISKLSDDEMTELEDVNKNTDITIGRSNLIDVEVNPRMDKSSESHMIVANELNEPPEDTSNKNLYLSISNKNISKENFDESKESELISSFKKEIGLEDILEETSCSLNNLRESEDVIQFISSSKSNMDKDKSEEHITPFRTLSESKQKPETTISSHTEVEENEIKIYSESKISQSTSTSIIDPCPSQAISCSTSSTSGKGRMPFYKSISSKHTKSEKKVQGNFFPDLYQMQIILESILVKRKPDPHYWQPTCSSKLKASEPKVFCIPTSYFQTIHELIRNKKSAQS